jgi:hypothetical protein
MQILAAFAPFIAFAVIDRIAGSLAGLIAGAIVALLLLGPRVADSEAVSENPGSGNDDLVLRLVAVFPGSETSMVSDRRQALC